MRIQLLRVYSTVAAIAVAVTPALGRLVDDWPYERLFKEAELVVIATAEATVDSDDQAKIVPSWRKSLQGQTTTFTVRSTLKGKVAGGTIKVLHFRLREGFQIINGPQLVEFRTKRTSAKETPGDKPLNTVLPMPDYLLYLKAEPDGRYHPVSGQVDPMLSVREMNRPDNDSRRK